MPRSCDRAFWRVRNWYSVSFPQVDFADFGPEALQKTGVRLTRDGSPAIEGKCRNSGGARVAWADALRG
jgi:hypothetical protein